MHEHPELRKNVTDKTTQKRAENSVLNVRSRMETFYKYKLEKYVNSKRKIMKKSNRFEFAGFFSSNEPQDAHREDAELRTNVFVHRGLAEVAQRVPQTCILFF